MNDQIWWYVARGSGVVAWAVMALGIFWGLALSSRFLGKRPKRNWMLDLHRFLGGMSVVFVGMHLASLVFDSYISFGFVDIVLPGATAYRPIAVAWGVIGLYLLAAVQATSMLRKHISKRAWRRTHFLSFPLFLVSTVHLLAIGTDSTNPLLRWTVLTTVVAIAIATAVRIARSDRQPPAQPGNQRIPRQLVRVPTTTGV
jgi:DMSO/TMAO reductase YedYZ heme-binding membrane subunit